MNMKENFKKIDIKKIPWRKGSPAYAQFLLIFTDKSNK